MKHNKKRNTAFIYEILTRELTQAIVSQDSTRKGQIITILKEFFSKGSVLAEELVLYRTLLETRNVQPKIAERLLGEAKVVHSRLDESTLFDAQSRLIAAINKGLGSHVWGTFVPNFKSLASVNAIFNPKTAVKKKVLFEQVTVDRMSSNAHSDSHSDLRPVDNLTYTSFITKFNEKYGPLLEEQKDLLNRYITSFADEGLELRLFLNEELSRLKEGLSTTNQEKKGEILSQKVQKVLEYLEEFRKREFDPADLKKILKTQELLREMSAND